MNCLHSLIATMALWCENTKYLIQGPSSPSDQLSETDILYSTLNIWTLLRFSLIVLVTWTYNGVCCLHNSSLQIFFSPWVDVLPNFYLVAKKLIPPSASFAIWLIGSRVFTFWKLSLLVMFGNRELFQPYQYRHDLSCGEAPSSIRTRGKGCQGKACTGTWP